MDKAIWSEEYNNELTYILEVQDEIAGKIVNKLNDKLNIEKSDLLAAEKRSTKNLEAYNLVQKGFKFLNEPFTLNKMGEAMDPLAESALKLDPKYSDAYALSTLAKVFKWMYKKRPEGVEFIKQEVEDRERALLHMDKAIQYDNKSRIAKALKIFIQQWNVKEISKANQMFTARSMMIDANMLLNEFPDDLFCQTLYWYFHLLRNNVSGSGPESYRETLNGFLASYHKLEKNKFNYNEPTEVLISFVVWENIPKLYGMLEEYDNLVDFLMLNKNNFCKDGTYGCLNTFVLGLIAEGFYTGYEFDNALEITNSIISKSQDELISLGFSIGDKKRSYYKFGMMNLKSGNYSNAINGFNEALKLSLAGAKITCDECEFNFSEKDEFNRSDLNVIYWCAAAWGGWINSNLHSMKAIAELPKVIALMKWVVKTDESFNNGRAHLFLGVFYSALPTMLGGDSNVALRHFEKNIEITKNRSLLPYVLMAEYYTRQIFDRKRHDELLKYVIQHSVFPDSSYALENKISQQRANLLLDTADDFF